MSSQIKKVVDWPTLLVVGILLVMLPYSPAIRKLPSLDSGIFLYNSQQILQGKMPYRDLWDHKGPLTYYIDVLGLIIGNGSQWGVWFLEVLFLSVAAILSFQLLQRILALIPALFGTLVWMVSLVTFLDAANYTESYGLAFQFGALYLWWQAEKKGGPSWRDFGIGLTLAGAILLRPNMVGIWLGIGIVLVVNSILARSWRSAFIRIGLIAGGTISLVGPVLLYFGFQNALPDFFDQFINYNVAYSALPFRVKRHAFADSLRQLATTGLIQLALAGWVMVACRVRPLKERAGKSLLLVILVALPIELLLTALGGRNYFSHYYVSWLPAVAVLGAYLCYILLDINNVLAPANITQAPADSKPRPAPLSLGLIALLAAVLVINPAATWIDRLGYNDPTDNNRQAIADYLKANTKSENTVLVWGAEVEINFLANRASPTPYSYQFGLMNPKYTSLQQFSRFVDTLQKYPPAFIVDATTTTKWMLPLEYFKKDHSGENCWQFDVLGCLSADQMGGFKLVADYVEANYARVSDVAGSNWPIYKRK